MNCPKCNSNSAVKNGIQSNNQRYKCKNCSKVFVHKKTRYTQEFKHECLHFYLRGTGIRAISEVKKISHSLLIYWIKNSAKMTKEKLRQELEKVENIEILEIDELFTYVKKNLTKTQNQAKSLANIQFYGLLSTETETKLLILK
jgi:transposase-like protein